MAQTSQDRAEKDLEALRADMATLRKDLSSLTSHVREVAGSSAQGLSEEARERMQRLRTDVEDVADTVGLRSRQSLDSVEKQIEERPLTAMLVAFLAGLLLGKLFDR